MNRMKYRAIIFASLAFAPVILLAEAPQPPRDERVVIIGAPDAPSLPPPINEIDLRKAFSPVAAPLRESVVKLLSAGQQIALGTLVSSDGKILTKASELRGTVNARLADERVLAVKVLGVAPEHDLALLQIDAQNLTPIKFDSADPGTGQWLATLGSTDIPLAAGVVSVDRWLIPADAVMGVLLADSELPGARVIQLPFGSAAAKAGVLIDDLIVRIDDEPIRNQHGLKSVLAKMKPGQKVSVRVQRGDDEVDLVVTLGKRGAPSERTARQATMGGKLSARRTGFPAVFQHDMVNLQPSDCGSPLIDLDGNFAGINIARAGRPETYAIPPSVVKQVLSDFEAGKYGASLESAKREPSTRVAVDRDRVRELAQQASRDHALRELAASNAHKISPSTAPTTGSTK